jgi:hypothetical protein
MIEQSTVGKTFKKLKASVTAILMTFLCAAGGYGKDGYFSVGNAKTPLLASDDLVQSLVTVIEPEKKPRASQEFIDKVNLMVSEIPRPILLLLRDKGATITIKSTYVGDNLPAINGAPSGLVGNSYFVEPPTSTTKNHVTISQYVLNKTSGGFRDYSLYIGKLYHGVGHAVDSSLGMFSESSAFERAYELDVKELPLEIKTKLAKFCKHGQLSQNEAFAELFACQYSIENNRGKKTGDNLLHQHFQRCRKLIENKLHSLE